MHIYAFLFKKNVLLPICCHLTFYCAISFASDVDSLFLALITKAQNQHQGFFVKKPTKK